MNGSYLLDTNIVIAIFQREKAVEQRLEAAAVLGELYFGATRSARVKENQARIAPPVCVHQSRTPPEGPSAPGE